MPLSSFAVDALGVVTICLVAILIVLGLFCIIYTLYFSARVRRSGFVRFGYFNGPWLVRIAFVVFGICWGTGEVVRLTFFRQQGRIFHSLDQQWQENLCKWYILSNLGFTEPCLFLIMSFLLHASLKWRGSGILNHKWNMKTTGYVLLYCLPIFILDFIIVMIPPKFRHERINILRNVPKKKFTSSYLPLTVSGRTVIACTYPMLCTMVHGLFTAILTACLLLLGRQMAMSVINKGLQKRVYILIVLVSSLLPVRVLLLGFSVFVWQEHFIFEALAFLGFLVLLSCVVVGIYMLVYLPMSDSLALNRGLGFRGGVEAGVRISGTSFDNHAESLCLMAATADQSIVETSTARTSLERYSDVSTKQSSISFQTLIKDEASSTGVYEEEMSLAPFSPCFRLLSSSSPGSSVAPRLILSSA